MIDLESKKCPNGGTHIYKDKTNPDVCSKCSRKRMKKDDIKYMKKIIKYHHKYDVVGGLRIFFCFTFEHAYRTEQNFDFCPSCGAMVKDVKELIEA